MVWSPKTKAKRILMNDFIWQKNTFNIHTQNWIKIINAFYHNIITCCPDLTFLASLNFLCRSFNIPFFEFFLAPSRWGKWKIPLKTWLVKSRFFLRRHKIDYESIKIHYTCSIPRVFLEKNRLRKSFRPLVHLSKHVAGKLYQFFSELSAFRFLVLLSFRLSF